MRQCLKSSERYVRVQSNIRMCTIEQRKAHSYAESVLLWSSNVVVSPKGERDMKWSAEVICASVHAA